MTNFDQMIAGLLRPGAYPEPVDEIVHIETHISHVLLAGDYAYKIKKPVNLGFLDFSTAEKRHFYCEEELRLNGRLAPQLYLAVVPITGSYDSPALGGSGPVLEYAVKMRRFDQGGLLSTLPLQGDLPERVAERVAAFHTSIPPVAAEEAFGTPEAVLDPMLANFQVIRSHGCEEGVLKRLKVLEDWTLNRHRLLTPYLGQRRAAGQVRECHGDMHRGNIALDRGEILIFDGIEFNPALRWIDTQSELAFLLMDLEQAGEWEAARRLLNRYLELTGDYAGLVLLNFYQVYRALVRTKVLVIRLRQDDLSSEERERDRRARDDYLHLAEGYTLARQPCLLLLSGVSGSGKSRLGLGLRAALPLIHLRSDIERKRLFGFNELDSTQAAGIEAGIYTAEAGALTYRRLLQLATQVVDAGYSPLVDATFLRQAQRAPFLTMASERGLACRVLACEAPVEVLMERLTRRAAQGGDPSEAGVEVLQTQLCLKEAFTAAEEDLVIRVDTQQPEEVERLVRHLGEPCHWPLDPVGP